MKELNIIPVWNVPYAFEFNAAVEVSDLYIPSDSVHIEILGFTQVAIQTNSAWEDATKPW